MNWERMPRKRKAAVATDSGAVSDAAEAVGCSGAVQRFSGAFIVHRAAKRGRCVPAANERFLLFFGYKIGPRIRIHTMFSNLMLNNPIRVSM